ncbi:hypothetical protein EDM76_02585 [bacterium]|nr:MAG: hypothetical protein EDM76_02585 [bacterium]MCL4232267.1 hypothetical protein [Dehalococcoidia bacterium]RIL01606.1 MAG: hypothetical protein DCC78_10200 [bacterium]
MTDWRDDLDRAREEARKAREEAERLRREADRMRETARAEATRLRNEAREMERRLRREARDKAREFSRGFGAHGPRHQPFPSTPPIRPPGPAQFGAAEEPTDGIRTQQSFSLDGIEEVKIDQTAGKVTLRFCKEGETPGVISGSGKTAPTLEVHREGSRLNIRVSLSVGWLFRRKQGAVTLVRLAPGLADLKVNLGYGTIQARDIACHCLRLDVGAGDIQTYSTHCSLDARMGAGKIAIYDHHGLATCDTGTGDLLIDIAEVADGDYRANAGIGRVEMRLPAGHQVRLNVNSGMGRKKIEYPAGPPDARIHATISTGVGEASVRSRQPGQEPATPPPPRAARPGRPTTARRHEAEELRILQMLEQGKISSQEAADLIAALQGVAPLEEEEPLDGQTAPGDDPGAFA